MTHLPTTEAVEEDAADLQFPKDWQLVGAAPTLACFTCGDVLKEPYIRCAQCKEINICTTCFASGAECAPHLNCHDYIVIKNEFSLFEDTSWTAKEEVQLLDALLDCGFGNWNSVSCHMQTRSATECEQHYLSYYVDDHCPKANPVIRKATPLPYFDPKLGDIDEPPRYSVNSLGYRALAGYNAARSDFEVEFDNFAEEDITDLDYELFNEKDEYQELGQELQAAIVSRYNERLKERSRRKRIIRDHGLIVVRKSVIWQQRYEQVLTRQAVDRLIRFTQLFNGMQMDLFMEGLMAAVELRQRITRLCEMREKGIKSFQGCQLYYKLLQSREKHLVERKLYLTNPEYSWRNSANVIPSPTVPIMCNPRRPAPPLDIVGLPMYEKLTAEERQLCSRARIVPESYLVFKNILISEYERNGSLKLAQARTLIKIDVNKTRKLFDFLLQEGYITQ